MPRRLLLTALLMVLPLGVATRAVADSPPTSVPSATTVPPVPSTIPDDFFTLFPEWSDGDLDYLDPDAHSSETSGTDGDLPATGGGTGVLAFASCAALVVGAAVSSGARRRARRQ